MRVLPTGQDPIFTVAGDTATADIMRQEKIVRNEGNSGSVFITEFSLAKEDGIWKIMKIDELTDAEIGE
ncbi:nuclear transport factor 2 family protein [Desulfosporosinus shakirovi]|uniref:nuclear transport factor 2 family protein n=1 Tax=Desulfosporosinus shakirovi TaxID=2885154 RepID=UPI001E4F0A24|nr:nuclear transport factor 2 family protein [Desulfosporosinus sp. SRJS8]MCB8815421.1 nuclear transport factor 2 family protein [Desulfosporosinus sp. SRJS8]